jgi:hypothetical protein
LSGLSAFLRAKLPCDLADNIYYVSDCWTIGCGGAAKHGGTSRLFVDVRTIDN